MEQIKQIIKCECNESLVFRLESIHSNGTVHIELQCKNCKKFLGYAPRLSIVTDVQEEKIKTDVIPFGKYKGTPFIQLAKNYPEYCHWLVDKSNIRGSTKVKVEAALAFTKQKQCRNT